MSKKKVVTVVLEEPVWKVFDRVKELTNIKLRGLGKPLLNDSGIISLMLLRTLLDQSEEILNEYEEVGLDQLSVRLANFFGGDGLAEAGLPAAPQTFDSKGRLRKPRPGGIFY
jgi:hypothetical protein